MTSISNADRVLFPASGVTKGELVEHYEAVADRLLPHVAGRPLTLERYPRGIEGGGFMQKNAPKGHPSEITICVVPKRDGDTRHPMVADIGGLRYLANLSTVSLHVPGATCGDLFHPDRLVFDLDPPEGFSDIGGAAVVFRQHLAELGLPTVPLATGSKGFHLVSFIETTVAAPVLARAAQGCAELAVRRRPDLFTVEFKKVDRGGRVFVDWLRNSVPATTIAPYAIRPVPDAAMATPLAWAEVDEHGPRGTVLRTAASRLREADPWHAAMEHHVDAAPFVASVDGALTDAGIELRPFDRFGR